eukprot:m.302796 g.302796  ORF g.302796 m.302796 type:complete len:404 (+) comp15459_c0_seq1:97-1308(+)
MAAPLSPCPDDAELAVLPTLPPELWMLVAQHCLQDPRDFAALALVSRRMAASCRALGQRQKQMALARRRVRGWDHAFVCDSREACLGQERCNCRTRFARPWIASFPGWPLPGKAVDWGGEVAIREDLQQRLIAPVAGALLPIPPVPLDDKTPRDTALELDDHYGYGGRTHFFIGDMLGSTLYGLCNKTITGAGRGVISQEMVITGTVWFRNVQLLGSILVAEPEDNDLISIILEDCIVAADFAGEFNLVAINCVFLCHHAKVHVHGTSVFHSCTFQSTEQFAVLNASATFTNCSFVHGEVGCLVYRASCTFQNSVFCDNVYGLVTVKNSDEPFTITLEDCTFERNTKSAVSGNGDWLDFRNCSVSGSKVGILYKDVPPNTDSVTFSQISERNVCTVRDAPFPT